MGAYVIPLRTVPMFLRSGWYHCYFGVDSVSHSTFGIFPATINNSPGHVSNHLGKVPPRLPTLGACGLRCCMSRGGSSHVAGCVFVARPGECGTHHDVLVWTPVMRISFCVASATLRLTCSAPWAHLFASCTCSWLQFAECT